MLTIAVPMAGASAFYTDEVHQFPKVFQEVDGIPMIQRVIENLQTIEADKRFIFIINAADASKYRLDNVLRMLTHDNCDIVYQRAPTRGAVCSLLLGIAHFDRDAPLLISNVDQLLDHDFNRIVDWFGDPAIDGGVVCFDSVHPQWSYAQVQGEDLVIEVAEKKPISRNAIAGLYYYRRSGDFIDNAMRSILKDRNHEGRFYTSLVFNEMILQNKQVRAYRIPVSEYHNFYAPSKIEDYERR